MDERAVAIGSDPHVVEIVVEDLGGLDAELLDDLDVAPAAQEVVDYIVDSGVDGDDLPEVLSGCLLEAVQ